MKFVFYISSQNPPTWLRRDPLIYTYWISTLTMALYAINFLSTPGICFYLSDRDGDMAYYMNIVYIMGSA